MPSAAAIALAETPSEDLRAERERAGLSQSELAGELAVTVASVKHWEAGRKPVPRGRVSELRRVLASRAPVEVPAMSGRELRELRERAQLGQADVAHLFGVAQPAVAAWEAGDVVPEARRELLREALAARVPAAALMRALRDRAGWKQAELAERVGTSQAQVSRWELGAAAPILLEEWPRIRDVLAAAQPASLQQPVTPAEIREGRRRLNWTQRDLADALGLPHGTVAPWASGAKPVPPGRWAQIRGVLGTARPAPPPGERDRVGEALQLVLAVVDAEPGLGRANVISRVDAAEPHARAAVGRALEKDLVHERRVPHTRGDGVVRFLPGLYPGPLPLDLPVVDRASLVVPEVLPAVVAGPGRTRNQVAGGLPHERRLGEKAIARAMDQGLVHERAVVVRDRGGTHIRLGLFPGASPPPAAAIAGDVLCQLRQRLMVDHNELAERLGVAPGLLRRWERSEVPQPWLRAVDEMLRPAIALAEAREADRRRRILEAVAARPGIPRSGELNRHVEHRELKRIVDELLADGELHERPLDGSHGAALFSGPPPPEWEPGPPIDPDELHAMRDWAGLTQKQLAKKLRASVASVNAWERGTKPVPTYRRGQLRQVLAERRPPDPPTIPGGELLAERLRAGLNQAELAASIGVSQAAISAWERGATQVPPRLREHVRQVLADAPTAPVVKGAELRRYRQAQGLTPAALGELLGVASPTIWDWEKSGVPRHRAAGVRELVDAGAESAQVALFE
jgi:DNA-binding transcriptional regulator YiaG